MSSIKPVSQIVNGAVPAFTASPTVLDFEAINYGIEPIRYQQLSPEAQRPYQEHKSDVGYQIAIVRREENRQEDDCQCVNYFATDLCFAPPPGYHLELAETPLLHKQGYSLSGSTIINPSSREPLVVGLYKFRDVPDIELPFRAIQIIPRKTEYILATIVRDIATSGVRGDGKPAYNMAPQFGMINDHYSQPMSRTTSVYNPSKSGNGNKARSHMY